MVPELREREPHVTGERLGAFVDCELEEAEAEAVRRHLAACPACRTDAGLLGRAGALLREAVAAEPAPDPEAVWQAVRTRIEAETPAGGPVPARRRFSPPAWLALPRSLVWTAAALVLIAGLTLLQTHERVTPSPEPAALPPPIPPQPDRSRTRLRFRRFSSEVRRPGSSYLRRGVRGRSRLQCTLRLQQRSVAGGACHRRHLGFWPGPKHGE